MPPTEPRVTIYGMQPVSPALVIRRTALHVVASLLLFVASFTWAWSAVSPEAATHIMLPTLVLVGIAVEAVFVSTIIRARRATFPEAERVFVRSHIEREIVGLRVLGIVVPIVLVVTWGGIVAARVWQAHPPVLYWAGAVAVTLALIIAVVVARRRLPEMIAARDSAG